MARVPGFEDEPGPPGPVKQYTNKRIALTFAALIAAISFGTTHGRADDRPGRIREATARAMTVVVSVRPMGIVAAPVAPPFVPPLPRFGRPPIPVREALIEQGASGSGVIVDAGRGLVLTSASVLRGSPQAEILLPDGTTRASRRVVFSATDDNLALIEFNPLGANLAQVDWGDLKSLQFGDDVLAVGRTASGELLVSAGIVVKQRRPDQAGSEFEPIVTDALIARENAGGPLLNMEGQVVGICQPGNEALAGFHSAISAAEASAAVVDLTAGGRDRRGRLGVTLGRAIRFPTEPFRRYEVVEVTGVLPGSPAAAAGIQPGDRILRVDGRPVRDAEALSRIVESAPIGAELTLRIERQGVEIEIKARTRAEGPEPAEPAPAPEPEPALNPAAESEKSSGVDERPTERPALPPALPEETQPREH